MSYDLSLSSGGYLPKGGARDVGPPPAEGGGEGGEGGEGGAGGGGGVGNEEAGGGGKRPRK